MNYMQCVILFGSAPILIVRSKLIEQRNNHSAPRMKRVSDTYVLGFNCLLRKIK